MNYLRIHDSIITKAKDENRRKNSKVIYEIHHIKPKAFFPELAKNKENLVLLTPKEHFLVHYLLWKLHPERKYRDPILYFKNKGASNSRLYEAARISHINEMKTNNPSTYISEEIKLNKSLKLKKYIKTIEHRKNISIAKTGKSTRTGAILNGNTKNKISVSLKKYFKNNKISDETREMKRIAMIGKTHNDHTKLKMKNSALNRRKWKCKLCDHAPLDGGNITQHLIKTHGWNKENVIIWKKIN